MLDLIEKIVAKSIALIEAAKDLNALNEIRVKILGKNGEYTSVLRGMKDVSPQDKPRLGKLINEGRVEIEGLIAKKEAAFKAAELERKLKKETVDVTLDTPVEVGSVHPITSVINEVTDIFVGLGFTAVEGSEVESDYYNFQLMNIPPDHPARDMQDTFYVSDSTLLRTHTSPMQAHTMMSQQPPIRIIVPGKVYRADDDATHSPIFHQIEGLVVDKDISLAHLKGTLDMVAKALFNAETKTRFRPSYFPFTEPSVEVDVSCCMCGGKGCRLCKGTGWLEILGAGVVNPVVLDNCGIDSTVYSGIAFGLGVDRIAMIKYGIPDIRSLYENDVRFLRKYK